VKTIEPSGWHLDRRVPLAMIGSIALQTAIAIWWAAGQQSAQADNARRITALETHNEQDRQVAALVSRDLGEIKGQLAILISRMQRESR
jgi:hypothetical protein